MDEMGQLSTLIIKGETNSIIMQSKDLHSQYLKILNYCDSVIFFRSNPSEKYQIVKFLKDYTNYVTLAIGDGSNDIQMIKEANIGVGIMGKEGNQAAYNADYSIGEFKMLWRLLIIHGQWIGYRMSFFVCFFFYKNFLLFFQIFLFTFYSAFSGQPYFDIFNSLLYNSLFTTVPIIYFAIFDNDFSSDSSKQIIEKLPSIFCFRRDNLSFNIFSYLKWAFIGICQSTTLFFTFFIFIDSQTFEKEGKLFSYNYRSFVAFFSTIVIQFIVLCMNTSNWNAICIVIYFLFGLIIYFPTWVFIYNSTFFNKDDVILFLSHQQFYIALTILILSSLIIYVIIDSIRFFYDYFPLIQGSKTHIGLLEKNNVNQSLNR